MHPYSAPAKAFLLPLGFVFANLIIYWGTFDVTWKLALGVALGQAIFLLAALLKAQSIEIRRARWRTAVWIWAWLLGLILIGWLGRYSTASGHEKSTVLKVLPEGIDDLVVALFSLAVFVLAVRSTQKTADVMALIEADKEDEAQQLDSAAV